MQCPGQDSRYWDGNAIFETECPNCGNVMEFFKDETRRRCKACKQSVLNPKMDFGCASYCPYAEQCLGTLPPEMVMKQQEDLIDRVAIEMKQYFGDDFKRIGHATRVARYAVQIAETEDGNRAVIMMAAYLHDIGIPESERKFNNAAPKYQHREGPPVARKILQRIRVKDGIIDEVCDIISHHHTAGPDESINFKVVYDADLITNLEEKNKEKPMSEEKTKKIVEGSFLTPSGRKLAEKVLYI